MASTYASKLFGSVSQTFNELTKQAFVSITNHIAGVFKGHVSHSAVKP